MKDVQIIREGASPVVRFEKRLWDNSELVLAKCYNFHKTDTKDDTTVILAFIWQTSKMAMYEFIRLSFKSFSESASREEERNMFYQELDIIWAERDAYVDDLLQKRIPYNNILMAHQNLVLKESFFRKHNFFAMDMGTGKAQPLSSKVLTPTGYREMGSIKVNDLVIDKDGNWCNVTGVYPQGKKEVFKITFSDGSVTHSCGEHLWMVSNSGWKYIVRELNDFKDRLRTSKGLLKWYVPTNGIVKFAQTEGTTNLPIHPYVLGALIGNGCIINKVDFSCDHVDAPFFISKLESLLPGCEFYKQKGGNYTWNLYNNGTSVNSYVSKALDEIGLFGSRSGDKFIPHRYLYSSIENRIELLRGLMDTDGHVSAIKSKTSFSTSSERLRDDFVFLVRSLGGVARWHADIRDERNNNYIVHVTLKDIIPFHIPRKANLCHVKKRMIHRRFLSVESIGEQECQCISVDSPSRTYLTDEFIVTHNTLTGATVSRLHQTARTVVICPAAVKYNWFRDLQKFGFNPVYFSIYDTSKSRSFKALVERFVIVNYDILGRFGEEICKHKIDHFILDESHMLKNHTSTRFKNVFKMVSLNPEARITFLSGTPITNRVNDIFAYLKLTGNEMGQSHKKFLDQYTVRTNSRGGERVTGGKNLDDLRIKLANFMIRIRKEDCLDLPDKVFMSYRYELDDYREEYNKILAELSQVKDRNRLTGNLHSLNVITSMAKIPGVIEIANNIIEEGRKVVIFSSYTEPLKTLEKHFADSCVKIDGSVSSFDRDRLVQLFIEDPNIKVFLGNMVAAGVGINLVNASDVVFVNFPLVPSELNQSIDRCHRIGQDRSVNVHLTMCEDSIDEVLHHLILNKEMEATTVLDGKASETLMRENFTEVLIKMLLGESTVIEAVEEPLFESPAPAEPMQPAVPVIVSLPPSNDLPNFL